MSVELKKSSVSDTEYESDHESENPRKTITYSKSVKILNNKQELMKEIRIYVGADCWGVYTQEQKSEDMEMDNKHVYFDTIARLVNNCITTSVEEDKVREELYTENSPLMEEVISKMDNGEILTVVMFGNQTFGDVSFFKVNNAYVCTVSRKDV